jgi:hypothetical protein
VVHHDLADGVEVEVLGGVHFGQQPGNLPPIGSVDLVQQLLLRVDITVIERELLRRQDKNPAVAVLVPWPGPIAARRPGPSRPPSARGGRGDWLDDSSQLAPEERAEVPLWAEDQSADDRVKALSADDEVEPVGGGVLERHDGAVGLPDDRADRVFEQVLRVASCRLLEDGGQFATHDLDVPTGDPGDQVADLEIDASAAVASKGNDLGAGASIDHRGQHACPLDHAHCRPKQVHGVAAGPCEREDSVRPR